MEKDNNTEYLAACTCAYVHSYPFKIGLMIRNGRSRKLGTHFSDRVYAWYVCSSGFNPSMLKIFYNQEKGYKIFMLWCSLCRHTKGRNRKGNSKYMFISINMSYKSLGIAEKIFQGIKVRDLKLSNETSVPGEV